MGAIKIMLNLYEICVEVKVLDYFVGGVYKEADITFDLKQFKIAWSKNNNGFGYIRFKKSR